ncbi:putative HD superfamily hydrolase [Methanonatronarchaeum thermophilum]|uniref:Putative HD superfamily hydrolase n=1 Tax=Methanonatronarchaeum thermophilum TaxID=1927129 RepID=A0A1Y3GBE2_9EURY|nr:HDIG domain-containing metalloprotein [Methanonatronarchaeum thermophilum]OUJ18781.1 putative HD superfamily hydrolase [Methanonatronarchaeum thermophilum]
MIGKNEAENMVIDRVDTENLRNHMYAVSAIMEELAKELDADIELWRRVGLLHDIDYEETKDNPKEHAKRSAEILEDKLPQKGLKAIKAHNHQHLDTKPKNNLDHALIAADAVSGLIVATALVMPNQKLKEARTESILKKFDDTSFAKNIDRNRILNCKKIGLEKKEFIETSLKALQKIDKKLGL